MNPTELLDFSSITKRNIVAINKLLEDFFKNSAGFNFRAKMLIAPNKQLLLAGWKEVTPAFAVKSIRDREKYIVANDQFIFIARSAKQAKLIGMCKPSNPTVTTSMVLTYRDDIDYHRLVTGAKIAVAGNQVIYAQKFNESLTYFLVITKREKKK